MKRLVLIVMSLLWVVPCLAGETQPSAGELQLRNQMRGLMQAFRDLETSLDKSPPDYDALLKTLDTMNERAKTVQSLKGSGHPGKEFNRLFVDIADFKKSVRAKSHSAVEDSMNRLAENCFRCHLSHDGGPEKTRAPSKKGNAL